MGRGEDLASAVLSRGLGRLVVDWPHHYELEPWLETLVDPRRHHGGSYRAANWVALGATAGRGCMDRHCRRVGEAPKNGSRLSFGSEYLSSREALQMSESDLERELHPRGQELIRKLLQGHLDQRGPGEAAGPVEGADGVERSERRVHDRRLETILGAVDVERLGYAPPGHDSLHPLEASLNLPGQASAAAGGVSPIRGDSVNFGRVPLDASSSTAASTR